MQIDVDFDVFKALTLLRDTEETSYNDIIRVLLKLDQPHKIATRNNIESKGVTFKGLHLPAGTQLRATYKGRTFTAEIQDGAWVDSEGVRRSSPSEAAGAITNTQINGWTFWEVRRPSDGRWRKLNAIRP